MLQSEPGHVQIGMVHAYPYGISGSQVRLIRDAVRLLRRDH